jgi:hypothetical protein
MASTIKFYGLGDFITKHLRFQQHWNKKVIRLEDAKWQTLENDAHVGEGTYAAGSQFKVFETQNFGWVVFKTDSLTPTGQRPGRFIQKF